MAHLALDENWRDTSGGMLPWRLYWIGYWTTLRVEVIDRDRDNCKITFAVKISKDGQALTLLSSDCRRRVVDLPINGRVANPLETTDLLLSVELALSDRGRLVLARALATAQRTLLEKRHRAAVGSSDFLGLV